MQTGKKKCKPTFPDAIIMS